MRQIGLAVFLAFSLFTAPLAAEAQQAGHSRLGFLGPGDGGVPNLLQALRDGLAEFNYVAGQNVVIDYRWAEEKEERLSALAADLVEHHVAAIVTPGPSAIRAAKRAGAVAIVAIDLKVIRSLPATRPASPGPVEM